MTQQTLSHLSAEEVVDYLRDNPQFFETHPDVLTNIQWTSTGTGHTISFAEKQIAFLRDKMADLEKKMLELIEFGTENDELLAKFHQLAVCLIKTKTLSEVFEVIYHTLETEFQLPHVTIRLWSDEETLEVGPEFEGVDEEQKAFIAQQDSPYVGSLRALPHHEGFNRWLWAADEPIQSVALLPLKDKEKTLGALLIGSSDPKKFTSQMGTLFLAQMTDQIAAAISKYRL